MRGPGLSVSECHAPWPSGLPGEPVVLPAGDRLAVAHEGASRLRAAAAQTGQCRQSSTSSSSQPLPACAVVSPGWRVIEQPRAHGTPHPAAPARAAGMADRSATVPSGFTVRSVNHGRSPRRAGHLARALRGQQHQPHDAMSPSAEILPRSR